jgi:hypothetical protein
MDNDRKIKRIRKYKFKFLLLDFIIIVIVDYVDFCINPNEDGASFYFYCARIYFYGRNWKFSTRRLVYGSIVCY